MKLYVIPTPHTCGAALCPPTLWVWCCYLAFPVVCLVWCVVPPSPCGRGVVSSPSLLYYLMLCYIISYHNIIY